MARPPKTDLAALWQNRINKGLKFQEEDFTTVFHPDLARQYFEGKQEPDGGVNPNEYIVVNKVYSHLLTELPSLYGIDPYFYVKVKKKLRARSRINCHDGRTRQNKRSLP